MLGIPDPTHQLKVADDIVYQQVLLAENINFKYKTIARLLKRDWKVVEMAKQTITDLIGRIQLIVTTLKKNLGNRLKILLDIEKYWG